MTDVKMEDIVSLCKRRGFIYPGSDVYGGLSGTWDYGPLGVTLKRNIMQLWWKMFVEDAEDMLGIDAAILMNQKVWQASGHVDTFTDPLVECQECGARYRFDKIINHKHYRNAIAYLEELNETDINSSKNNKEELEEALKYTAEDATRNKEELTKLIRLEDSKLELFEAGLSAVDKARKYVGGFPKFYLNKLKKVTCDNCGKINWADTKTFNMMFKTNIGPIEDENSISYLRPETAQGIFTNYKNVVDSFYPNVPFGIAQQGKAFRNEISPRDFIFRSREFEQMEIEYFVHPDQWKAAFEEWVKRVHLWCDALGLPADSVHELEVEEADRAHYSRRTIDFEFDFPIGREELLGLAYRTDFDLKNIERVSKKNMEYRPKDGSPAFVPHVIEPSFGVERALMAALTAAYREDEVNGEKRIYLKFPKALAPVKVAVLPLVKNKPELVAKAREVYAMLQKKVGNVMWIDSGNIGKNYRKMDEIGVPHCITIDFETIEGDTAGTVTVRDRDTTEQKRIKIEDLIQELK